MGRLFVGFSACLFIAPQLLAQDGGRLMRFGAGVSNALRSSQANAGQAPNGTGAKKPNPGIIGPNTSGQSNAGAQGGFAGNPFLNPAGLQNRPLVQQAQAAVRQIAPQAGPILSQLGAAPSAATPATGFSNQPIVLRCSSTAKNPCSYKLTEGGGTAYPYSIAPGKKQVFNETTNWELSFDRGDGQVLRYGLSGGEIYELREENGMWVCYCAS